MLQTRNTTALHAISLARMQQTDEAKTVLEEAVACGLDTDSINLVKAELDLSAGQWQKQPRHLWRLSNPLPVKLFASAPIFSGARAYRLGQNPEQEIAVLEEARGTVAPEKSGPALIRSGQRLHAPCPDGEGGSSGRLYEGAGVLPAGAEPGAAPLRPPEG